MTWSRPPFPPEPFPPAGPSPTGPFGLPEWKRSFFRLGGAVFILSAWIPLAMAWFIPGAAVDTPPLRVTTGQAITLPDLSLRADAVYLVGRPLDQDGTFAHDYWTIEAELGCTITQPAPKDKTTPAKKARVYNRPLFVPPAISGQELWSLIEIGDYADGSRLTCSGPKVTQYQPIYLVGGESTGLGVRLLFAMIAVFALVIGIILLVVLRKPKATP